jgi:hypothetical protein
VTTASTLWTVRLGLAVGAATPPRSSFALVLGRRYYARSRQAPQEGALPLPVRIKEALISSSTEEAIFPRPAELSLRKDWIFNVPSFLVRREGAPFNQTC